MRPGRRSVTTSFLAGPHFSPGVEASAWRPSLVNGIYLPRGGSAVVRVALLHREASAFGKVLYSALFIQMFIPSTSNERSDHTPAPRQSVLNSAPLWLYPYSSRRSHNRRNRLAKSFNAPPANYEPSDVQQSCIRQDEDDGERGGSRRGGGCSYPFVWLLWRRLSCSAETNSLATNSASLSSF